VNVERASRLGDRMGGHLVLGHVDGVGRVLELEASGEAQRMVVEVPAALGRYLADKGSVAIDGVSLTINRLTPPRGIELMLVPHTLAETTLRERGVGDAVNVEVDVLARYVARLLEHAGLVRTDAAATDDRLMQLLRNGGYAD
jgi:riboflavin synthase